MSPRVCPVCSHVAGVHECADQGPRCTVDGCEGCGWCDEEIELYGDLADPAVGGPSSSEDPDSKIGLGHD